MNDLREKSLALHKENKGKISISSKVKIETKEDLALAYSPGVAEPCKEIQKNPDDIYTYTSRGNTVAVISDGTAVLGLGDIGVKAGLPVMEGKAILFKEFAGIDAFPIMIDTKDPDEFIETVERIATSFGGINLEDIKAPNCVYIERRLKKSLDIPVFHDDQHGTAIVTLAALINSCRLTKKKIEDLKIIISGTGAAGSNIAKLLHLYGIKKIYGYNIDGPISDMNYNSYNFLIKELLDEKILCEPEENVNSLESLIKNKDVFIGVSAKNILTEDMILSMNKDPFIFAMANPDPEIPYQDAVHAKAYIIGTGRSDYPNQINNVLAFPGLFKGALQARSKNISEEMKIAAAKAIAYIIKDDELSKDYIIPSPFNKAVVEEVSKAVYKEAMR